MWPSSSGLAVKNVSEIEIFPSDVVEERASDTLAVKANVILSSLGISLDTDSIDFGDIRPGESSATETVEVTNTGSVDFYVSIEVQGQDETAQNFYEQSLYIDSALYDINTIIASILNGDSEDVEIQLQVPQTWNEAGGEQEATLVFWAEASGQD